MEEEQQLGEDELLRELESWRHQNWYGPPSKHDEEAEADLEWPRYSEIMVRNAASLPDFFKDAWMKLFEVGYQMSDLVQSVRKFTLDDWGPSDLWSDVSEVLSTLFGMSERHRQQHKAGQHFESCEDWEDSQYHANHFRLDLARVLMAMGYNEDAEKVLRSMLVPQCGEGSDESLRDRLAMFREFAIRDLRNIQAVRGDIPNALTFDSLLPSHLRWPSHLTCGVSLKLSSGCDAANLTFFGRDD